MEDVRVLMKTDPAAKLQFQKLHEASRLIFTGTIVFALASLVLPVISTKRISD
jgi:hypothetical protein